MDSRLLCPTDNLNDLGNYSTSVTPLCPYLFKNSSHFYPSPHTFFLSPLICGEDLQCHTFGPLSLWCYLPSDFCAAQFLWLSPPLLPFAPQLFQTLIFLAQSLTPLPLSAHDLVFCFSAAAALSWSSTINCPSLYLVPIYSSNCPFFVYITSEAASTPSPRAPTTSLCTKSCPFKPMVLNWGHLSLLGNI